MNMVILYATAIYFNVAVASDVLLQNPSPVPLGGEAVFTCSATSLGIIWTTIAVNNKIVSDPASSMPVPRTSRITVPAISVNNNTNITCRTIEQQQSTTQLYIYGPPSEPVDLSSESISNGVLVFSWSPPWAPDEVQLNYTVIVTNTNTSVVRNYTTSNTSITLTRSDVEGDGECDQYVWSVTVVNPAGISGPANYTTAVSFVLVTYLVVSPSHNVSTVGVHSSTSVISTTAVPSVPPPSESSLPPTAFPRPSGSVLMYILVVLIVLLLVVVVLGIALIMYWQWRKWQKTHTTCFDLSITKSHLSESSEKVLEAGEEELHPQEKKVPTQEASMLPEYATPADIRKAKEVELVKQNETSKRSTLKSPQGKSHSSAPPPPPSPGPGDYASLQHDTGQPSAQENNTYDIPQNGDAPHLYSSVGQPPQALKKTQYSELQHMSSSGDRVHGTTNVVDNNIVGPESCPTVLPPGSSSMKS